MKFKKYFTLTFTFYIFLLLPFAVNGHDYRFVTGYLPPWSMPKDEAYPGVFVEIAREIDRRLGNETKIEVYPWPRALELAQEESNIIIFPLAKTPSRETLYTWIDTIKQMEMVFVSLTKKVHSFDEAKTLTRILVHKGAPPDLHLERYEFTNLAKFPALTSAIPRMLTYDRADAWYTPKDIAHWMWKLNPDIDTPYFSASYTMDDLTFAGAPSLSPESVERVRAVLSELKNEKFIDKVILKYRR